MPTFEEQYKLWDKFLERWTIENLKSMTLEEYTTIGGEDSFTTWLTV